MKYMQEFPKSTRRRGHAQKRTSTNNSIYSTIHLKCTGILLVTQYLKASRNVNVSKKLLKCRFAIETPQESIKNASRMLFC